MKRKRIISVILSLAIFCALFTIFTRLLTPKYAERVREGALIGEYYLEADEGREHQVIFLGDCEAYESFIPAIMWEECQFTSFVRGSPAQRVWQSYYLLLDTLRYERPEVVVLSVYALCHGGEAREEHNRLTLDGMRLSGVKIHAVKASVNEEEGLLSYIFPLLRYHSRWAELLREDIEYFFSRKAVSHNGYLMQVGSLSPSGDERAEELYDYNLPQRAMEYLDKIRLVCESEGIALVLVKAPTQSARYYWYDEWDSQVREYAESYGIAYYNLINNDRIGISDNDYADGLHLNLFGAEKTSRYFSNILKENFFASTEPPDDAALTTWNDKLEEYYIERKILTEKTK